MNTAETLDCHVRDDDTVTNSPRVTLTVISNHGELIDNSELPLGCHYCELKTENNIWRELW